LFAGSSLAGTALEFLFDSLPLSLFFLTSLDFSGSLLLNSLGFGFTLFFLPLGRRISPLAFCFFLCRSPLLF
jgi:hypothetical protein